MQCWDWSYRNVHWPALPDRPGGRGGTGGRVESCSHYEIQPCQHDPDMCRCLLYFFHLLFAVLCLMLWSGMCSFCPSVESGLCLLFRLGMWFCALCSGAVSDFVPMFGSGMWFCAPCSGTVCGFMSPALERYVVFCHMFGSGLSFCSSCLGAFLLLCVSCLGAVCGFVPDV